MTRTITTVTELDALPIGSVVREPGEQIGDHTFPGEVLPKDADGWLYDNCCYRHKDSSEVALPATLLYEPGQQEPAQTAVPASHHGEQAPGHSTICSWCLNIARGNAWHNDGKLYPSCGATDHGQGWVPEHRPLPDREQIAEAIHSADCGCPDGISQHDTYNAQADAVLELLR